MDIYMAVVWLLILFMLIGIADKITGNRFGYGEAFEEGFRAMGPLGLVMIGMISAAPVLADWIQPAVVPLFQFIGADPAVFFGMLLAIDMGGYSLALELAETPEAGLFAGVILATMIGPVFVFTIPVALGLINPSDYSILGKGMIIGLIPVPAGAFAAGALMGMPWQAIFVQLIPVLFLTAVLVIGMSAVQPLMIRLFIIAGRGIIVLTTVLIGIVGVQELSGAVIVEGMTPFAESMEIIGVIALVLAGAFPFVHFIKRSALPHLQRLCGKKPLDDEGLAGFISQFAHSIPMYKRLDQMGERAKLINIAFSVSGAFVLGAHLGFTAAVEPNLVIPMIAGKLTSGVLAVCLADQYYRWSH
ncbi:ethanolamine utilization protein EutH [Salisediminibacterium halotolerans]|uniref:ethanolamine utilization protein EutH n=1 Tax=Salisediminibacterium halotolerans TaxID=517425 RepID=UPI000EB16B58|nr:ethanolamine utilization protein EutH [Salisediminibacterium halotolerans]RLJ72331.1 ethanolamine transporter [Actinophytocola xinjiangensis]RPE85545.1 ethanolamine transporter [Salisediminibacterium halotolerans]TWG33500.1 ethanolamine transporter [Salisediminibacterium halotolerans]GEL08947.1 ethanolamine utilization protein EutH [Salisediminibacterium halotolerans]